MEEHKLVDVEEVKDVLGDTINSEGDYRHALRLLNGLNSVTEQDIVKSILDKIRAEIEQTSKTVDGFLMHDGTKRTALQILDKYNVEKEELIINTDLEPEEKELEQE